MWKVGPNPYGLCHTLGIQGNLSNPKNALWFFDLATKMGAASIEFHCLHLASLSNSEFEDLEQKVKESRITPIISGPWPLERVHESIPFAKRLGVGTIRTHLTPVLSGARAALGKEWSDKVQELYRLLSAVSELFLKEGLTLAIENHQDFGSKELLDFCEAGGPSVGICLDTGNPLAVAEDPIEFARNVAPKIRHIHLKDYRAQRTEEGYRLVRCPIGDGAIPFQAIFNAIREETIAMTATLEPGALEARHIELLTDNWWKGYRDRSETRVKQCFQVIETNELSTSENWRTPFERGKNSEIVSRYEQDQMAKSVQNMRNLGWLPK